METMTLTKQERWRRITFERQLNARGYIGGIDRI